MNISRDNYESWFLDYLDGKLNAGQAEVLMSFLEFNPDLKEELDGMEMVRLDGAEIKFDLKAALRKPDPDPDPRDVLDHFEDYCLMSIERQLSPQEEQILQGIIADDAEKKRVYGLYQSTVLRADEDLLYPWKSRLKRRYIHIPGVRIAAALAAASAVLLLALLPLVRNAGDKVADVKQLSLASEPADNGNSLEDHPQIPGTVENESGKAPGSPTKKETFSEPNPFTRTAISGNRTETISPGAEQGSLMRAPIQMAKLESIKAGKLQYSGQSNDPSIAYRERVSGMDDYMSLDEYALLQLKKRIPGKRADNKLSFWRLADAGIQRINAVSAEDYSLVRETDDYGKICRLTLETPVFGVSAPLRSAEIPRE